ncbi:MAG TPA: metallophosphoesterase, partial [Anaerolineales bacterium]|nr:metallophosphoesterase [Anaerolineales bacterium]
TDARFTTLDQSIDAWFNQNERIFTDRPFMPSYGNHEYSDADDADGYDEWAARFATPPGFNGQQFYSFDVGTAHFVSLYVPTGTINAAQEAWLSADLAAANAAGKRWIIPYFHIPPFSDGTNHTSSLSLRNELGPIFEQYGVQVVLTAHDQSYERTYPLVDVPNTNTPTSSNLACYNITDGVVWVKASPGGKLSNVNWNYSDFKTQPQPYWTAVRSNEQHHFVQLEFNPDGSLRVNVYGVTGEGDGTTPSLVDSFLITDQPCGAELAFDMPVVEETLDFDDAPVEMDVNLRAIGGTLPGSFTLSGGASWLTYSQLDADTVHLQADPSGLAPGIYTAEVLADSAGYRTARTLVILHVRGNTGMHEIELSLASDRSNPVPLHNQTVSGEIYAFVPPEAVGIVQVRFLLNGSRYRAEGNLPYDLAGSAPDDSALPFDTSTLPNGENNGTAVIVFTDGTTEVASATFNVLNVETAPVGVTLSGPAAGEIDKEYTFTATVDPITATTPLTYVWSIDGSPTITYTGGISDTEAFLWPTPGIKTVAVTVSNAAGEVSDSVTIDIQTMVVQDQSLYLPIVRKADGQP